MPDYTERDGKQFEIVNGTEYQRELEAAGARAVMAEKSGYVLVRRANAGERIPVYSQNGLLETTETGEAGKFILTKASPDGYAVIDEHDHANSWQVDEATLRKKYDVPAEIEGEIFAKPKGGEQRFLEIDRDIALDAPWGETQYIEKGGFINVTTPGDIYGISQRDFNDTYRITKEQTMNMEDNAGILRKARAMAGNIVSYLDRLNAHIARSHAKTQDAYLGGGTKIIPPNTSQKFGAVLSSHKTAGMQDDLIPENAPVEKKPPLSDEPGKLAMDKKKPFGREFPFPNIWREAARVMNIRYHADAVVQFARKNGFDIQGFCREKYPNGTVKLAELPDRALEAMEKTFRGRGEDVYRKYREFLAYGYIKKEQTSVNDYRSLVVFNAMSWYYSPYQSMTTPFLTEKEAAVVSEMPRMAHNDILSMNHKDIRFEDTCGVDDIFNIKAEKPSKIALVPEPITFVSSLEKGAYLDDADAIKRQLVEVAGEVYPHVDFTQMNVPDDAFFAQRRESIMREEEAHAGRHAEFSEIDDIPWMSDARSFMDAMNIRLQIHYRDMGMEEYGFGTRHSLDHVTANGGLVTGYDSHLRVEFNKIDQIEKFGDIYQKGFWLAETHQQRHNQAVRSFFHISLGANIDGMISSIESHLARMPKDANGDVIPPKNENDLYDFKDMMVEYDRYKKAKESLDDEAVFSHYVHAKRVNNPREVSSYLAGLDGLSQKPALWRDTSISFNSANPDDPFRISTAVEYATYSYVSMTELNNNQGRYKEIRSESMPVPKTFEEFKEAYVKHLEEIYPTVDIREMAELKDFSASLGNCAKPSMSM